MSEQTKIMSKRRCEATDNMCDLLACREHNFCQPLLGDGLVVAFESIVTAVMINKYIRKVEGIDP